MAETSADPVLPQPLRGGDVAAMSNEDVMGRLDLLFRQKAAVDGAIVVLLGEVGRREAYRDEGATAAEPWVVERFGVSTPTARAYTHVAERAWDLPHLVTSLSEGEITFDKLRAVSDVATPETDPEVRDRARECSVPQLAELARRSVTAQLPAESCGGVPPMATSRSAHSGGLHQLVGQESFQDWPPSAL